MWRSTVWLLDIMRLLRTKELFFDDIVASTWNCTILTLSPPIIQISLPFASVSGSVMSVFCCYLTCVVTNRHNSRHSPVISLVTPCSTIGGFLQQDSMFQNFHSSPVRRSWLNHTTMKLLWGFHQWLENHQFVLFLVNCSSRQKLFKLDVSVISNDEYLI